MKSIWKFPIDLLDRQEISLPSDARILCVQTQSGLPFMWAKVDTEAQKEKRTFRLIGTGHPIEDDSLSYIGTFQIYNGSLVFHLFEETSPFG